MLRRNVILFVVSLFLFSYFTVVAVKADVEWDFSHVYIWLISAGSHMFAMGYIILFAIRTKTPYKRVVSVVALTILIGSLLTQLLLALKMDLLLRRMSYSAAITPFTAALLISLVLAFFMIPTMDDIELNEESLGEKRRV